MLMLLTKPHLLTQYSWSILTVLGCAVEFSWFIVLGFVYCCWYEQKKILYCWDSQPTEVLSALTGKL